jgi:hypothetical protein
MRSRLALAGVAAAGIQFLSLFGGNAALAAPQSAKASTTGYDISYPQCSSAFPSGQAFGIVGVNGGRAYTGNPCLATEYAWASSSTSSSQPHVSFYLNTGNPGPTASTHWPAPGTTTPRPCDGSWSANCAYDYGWNAAQDSFNGAAAAAGLAPAKASPWWLDVETANSWSTDTTTNHADLEGAVARLKSLGVGTVGIYSTASMWAQITGATSSSSPLNEAFHMLPNWVPGARSAKEAPNLCSRTFAGGPVKLVQFPSGGFDGDYACF